MADKPFFSIAVPTYNRSDKLRLAIQYLLAQNFSNFEIVISDNCSTDKTRETVASFKSRKIKYFRNKTNIDVLPNVKKVIALCSGEYVFLHGDDDFLIDKNALSQIYKIIKKTKVGYVRCNYLSLSPDGKHIFDFRVSKTYTKDVRLKPMEQPVKVIDFLIKADCSFLTGIVFKNELPRGVSIIDSHLYSWFPIIFYCAEEFGAYYIDKFYIVSGWSEWRVNKRSFNSLYSIVSGKLTSEKYLNFVKGKLQKSQYDKFIKETLGAVYVSKFLAIKLLTGNRNMLGLASRIRFLEPSFKYRIIFWINLFLALAAPKVALIILRKLYLFMYIRRLSMDHKYDVNKILTLK